MKDNRTFSAIDMAIQKFETPVGALFFVECHGRKKRLLSRDAAIQRLAFFLTSHAFARSGFKARHPDAQEIRPEGNVWLRGGITVNYHQAHQRTVRRLRRILARKREMNKWCAKWDAMHDRFQKEREELLLSKPAEVR